ncbi:MAG: tRNA uridine(34) 5-carboxymethylaminomethyl modification radical SAM/GNAT enzyme Elp3 [Candidatus Altiarchaeota archaeon]
MKKQCRRVIEAILSGEISSRDQLDLVKRGLCEELGLDRFIRNSEILKYAKPSEREMLLSILQKKPARTLSGVAVVALMTRPHKCPHGRCKYCPGGPDSDVPQSYTGKEPATRRAIQYGFDPYLQVTFRLNQLASIGHPIYKVELIVMGGTLTAQCLDYQEWVVKEAFRALNEFEKNKSLIAAGGEEEFIKEYGNAPKKFQYMEDIQKANEASSVRCTGLTFEPRPDWARKEQIDYMLGFGVTRVEIGVQNPDDAVYELVDRGHTVADVVDATRELKDCGLKVGYHMMPGITGFDPEADLEAFRKIFFEDDFKPDMVKIYPCIILKDTEYYLKWKAGEYEPLTTEQAVDIIVEVKKMMPAWVRTMRIMRDIPSNLVEAGIKSSNLGQLVYERMRELGVSCSCIRCREVGRFLEKDVEPHTSDIKLVRRQYTASGGEEAFLSFEDVKQDILIGFLRLRKPGKPLRPEIDDKTSLVRELHVYGPMLELGEKPVSEWQHRGFGRELLAEAEKIAFEEQDSETILVTSGVGVRPYYRKFGYKLCGPYMGKTL